MSSRRLNSGDELFRLVEDAAVVEIGDRQQTDRRYDEERKNNFRASGIFFFGTDAFNIVTNVSSGFRILVPRHQSEQAARFLDELLTS